ncbi:MAG: adenylyltransferase/cytidyltransferase family protein [Patescibacteria group bacterium]|nr:adenylyltransferase/cytidyltransferase family protein [Patescibacteria group bacterium]
MAKKFSHQNKIKTLSEVVAIARRARRAGKKVVATNGCFDILHVGHIRNFAAAKALGDILIVGINSDVSVRNIKGSSRPIILQKERAEMLAALKDIDYVFVFGGTTPHSWIQKIRPHIHVKGGGADIRKHPLFKAQQRVIEDSGGTFILVPHVRGKSTSDIIRKIQTKK